jgi:hypothetical protein
MPCSASDRERSSGGGAHHGPRLILTAIPRRRAIGSSRCAFAALHAARFSRGARPHCPTAPRPPTGANPGRVRRHRRQLTRVKPSVEIPASTTLPLRAGAIGYGAFDLDQMRPRTNGHYSGCEGRTARVGAEASGGGDPSPAPFGVTCAGHREPSRNGLEGATCTRSSAAKHSRRPRFSGR